MPQTQYVTNSPLYEDDGDKNGEQRTAAAVPEMGNQGHWFCREMISEFKARLPYYASDFKDGRSRKVYAAIPYMFFASVAPALTFAAWLEKETDKQFGVVEVLMSSVICGSLFALLGGQNTDPPHNHTIVQSSHNVQLCTIAQPWVGSQSHYRAGYIPGGGANHTTGQGIYLGGSQSHYRAGYIPGGGANHTTGQGIYLEGEPITLQGRGWTRTFDAREELTGGGLEGV
eukprot:1196331-Prorocentrum_minimum.AAC.3